MEIKVAQNSYIPDALLCVRKNCSNSNLSINIPAGETRYFEVSKAAPVETTDEIYLHLNASENSSSRLLEFTARVVAK